MGVIIFLVLINLIKVPVYIKEDNVIEENVQVPCENDDHCEVGFQGYKCLENVCQCVDKSICKRTYIQTHVTRISKFCNASSLCYMENSRCNNGKCECMNKTVASTDRRRCLKINTELNSTCEESSQCLNLSAFCIDKQCSCPQKMHSVEGICFNSIAIESACQRNEECAPTEFSHCFNMTCKCNIEYVYSQKYSKCLLKAHNISSECLENEQCSSTLGFGSECYRGFCSCKELYHYKTSIKKCVRDALMGNECGNHSDCHQIGNDENRLECLLGICKCRMPYVELYGYCVKNSGWTWTSFSLPDILPFVLTYAFFYVIR